MSTPKKNDDLEALLPDLEAIRRQADPLAAEEKHRSALYNPELDRALAEVQQRDTPAVAAPIPARGVAPSRDARDRRRLRTWMIGALAVLAVLAPVTIMKLFERARAVPPDASSAAIEAPVPPSATPAASAMPAASTAATGSIEPLPAATAVPSAVPSVDADAGAPAPAPQPVRTWPSAPRGPRAAPTPRTTPTTSIAPDIMH